MLIHEAISLHLVGEEDDRPGMGCARSAQRLATVIALLEEIQAIVM
jgi:hypothetical protein